MVIHIAVYLLAVVAAKQYYEDGQSVIPYTAICKGVGDVTMDYRAALDDFTVDTFKKCTALNSNHVVYAPTSMWVTLAAIAEGANHRTQTELFKLLKLPNDPCVRQEFYKLATSRILPGADIRISNTRTLVIDELLTINPGWLQYVSRHSLLDVVPAPINSNPKLALDEMRQIIGAKLPKLNLDGNSVLLDAMDFSGLWLTAFPDAIVEKAPFYAPNGQQLGYVDLMRMRRYVRMTYIPHVHGKYVELPLGINSRYSIIFLLIDSDADAQEILQGIHGSLLKEVPDSLRESAIPLEIAIPQYTMTSEIDARAVLEALGINSLWNDTAATRFISKPAALPSSYVQRVTISIHTPGAYPAPFVPEPSADAPTGLPPRAGRDFIANRPFIFGLYDAQTSTVLMTSAFSQPTYPL